MTDQPSPSPHPSADEIGYADALAELEEILDELDDESIDIDVLSERVERASLLISICRGRIAKANERVSQVVADLESTPQMGDKTTDVGDAEPAAD